MRKSYYNCCKQQSFSNAIYIGFLNVYDACDKLSQYTHSNRKAILSSL